MAKIINTDYVSMLRLVGSLMESNERIKERGCFTTREIYKILVKYAKHLKGTTLKDYEVPSKKVISNELYRLYKMGFLTRKKIRRSVRTKTGKRAYRGYQYCYSISSSGWNYLGYLKRIDEEDKEKRMYEVDGFGEMFVEKLKSYGRIKNEGEEKFLRFMLREFGFKPPERNPVYGSKRTKRYIKELEKKIKMLEANIEELKKKIKEKDEAIKEKEGILKEYKELLDVTKREVKKNTQEIKELNEKLKDCQYKLKMEAMWRAIHSIGKESDAEKVEAGKFSKDQIVGILEQTQKLEKEYEDILPDAQKLRDENERLRSELARCKEEYNKLQNLLSELLRDVDGAKEYMKFKEMGRLLAPGKPRDLRAEVTDEGIKLKWKVPEYLGNPILSQYVVHRNNKPLKLLPSTQEEYLDRDVKEGETYEYYVLSANKWIGVNISNIVKVKYVRQS